MKCKEVASAFSRFGVTGVFFTLLGPIIFLWAYQLGALLAYFISESVVHTVRYILFRLFVFTDSRGYRVTPLRYFLSILPSNLAGALVVLLLSPLVSKFTLIVIGTFFSVLIGFAWSFFLYKRPLLVPKTTSDSQGYKYLNKPNDKYTYS